MELAVAVHTVTTRVPFRIARGESSRFPLATVSLRDADGVVGLGEAAPSAFFGETIDTVSAALEAARRVLATADQWSIEAVEAALVTVCPVRAARAALSAALHDRWGKQQGQPLWKLWGLDPTGAPPSSYTIGIAPDLQTLARRVGAAVDAGYPILKVKLGTEDDAEILRTVRASAPQAVLRVDANAGWSVARALVMLDVMAGVGVESLEQPVAVGDVEGLRAVRAAAAIPVIADESCCVSSDIAPLVGAVDGINIKLGKCGGLLEARRMIELARARGLRVMCGCRIESSLGIAPAAQLGALLDDADLDGAALLADDPFEGPTIDRGVLRVAEGPGLGVRPRDVRD